MSSHVIAGLSLPSIPEIESNTFELFFFGQVG